MGTVAQSSWHTQFTFIYYKEKKKCSSTVIFTPLDENMYWLDKILSGFYFIEKNKIRKKIKFFFPERSKVHYFVKLKQFQIF